MSGDLAESVETMVADHVVSHLWEHTYLLWFDDQLMPHLQPSKPPTAAELVRRNGPSVDKGSGCGVAKFGPVAAAPRFPNSRGFDQQRKLLFLAVGQYISPRLLLKKLADLGAKDGMLLDGGSSSSMAIGQGAAGVQRGYLWWLAARSDVLRGKGTADSKLVLSRPLFLSASRLFCVVSSSFRLDPRVN